MKLTYHKLKDCASFWAWVWFSWDYPDPNFPFPICGKFECWRLFGWVWDVEETDVIEGDWEYISAGKYSSVYNHWLDKFPHRRKTK